VPDRCLSLDNWWSSELTGVPSKEKKQRAAVIIYTTWNLWKERNRRIFEAKSSRPPRLLQLIEDEMALRDMACLVEGQSFLNQ
jgi:hypothetical protein